MKRHFKKIKAGLFFSTRRLCPLELLAVVHLAASPPARGRPSRSITTTRLRCDGARTVAASSHLSLISFDPKSNTLIRVREHRRPSSSSSSLEEASGGDRYSLTQPATGQLAAATTAATGDCSESVPSSPAPELSPSSCPPVGRFELLSPRTAFPALIDGSPQQRQQQQSSATARRSLLFDCSAASAIRLSSHSVDNGTSATDAATGGDCGDRSKTAATLATTAFRPRVGTTNETMLGMFV
ncbi:hypothetical protein niasHT_010509 [Heterodera trifolii]|uniref:Uncharacterized protein n=1 Tax=Heterodera trifolii TaxID=157864 RepID=A0ABD2L1Z7_9BILA